MKRRIVTTHERGNIQMDYRAGMTWGALSKKYKLSRSAIGRAIGKKGRKAEMKHTAQTRYLEKEVNKGLKLQFDEVGNMKQRAEKAEAAVLSTAAELTKAQKEAEQWKSIAHKLFEIVRSLTGWS